MGDLKQRADEFLERLYIKSGEDCRIMEGRDVLQDLGMDEQTGINVVENLAHSCFLEVLARTTGNDASVLNKVRITTDGLKYVNRLRDAKGGIPLFYTESLERKDDKQLEKFISELVDSLGRIDTGSRSYNLLKEKIAQAKYALERRGAKRDHCRSTWALAIAILSLAISILLKILFP